MSRAAFTFKTKAELARMRTREVNAYIRTLELRVSVLSGAARKSTEKQLAVALRVRESLPRGPEYGAA